MSHKLPAPLACFVHHAVVGPLSVSLHDRFFVTQFDDGARENSPPLTTTRIALFLGAYWAWLLSFRLFMSSSKAVSLCQQQQRQHTFQASSAATSGKTLCVTEPTAMVWYEMPWLCNMTLFMSAWALLTNRTVLALAYGLTVSIDQLIWYYDGLVLLVTGKTVVGVFRHIFLPTARWYHHLTTWHHLWTLPLLMLAAACNPSPPSDSESGRLVDESGVYRNYRDIWLLSGAVMTLNVLCSRLLTPFGILVKLPPSFDDKSTPRRPFFYYLNVNLSYEVWKDLSKTISFLRIEDDYPSTAIYLSRLLVRWMFLNTVILVLAAVMMETVRIYASPS